MSRRNRDLNRIAAGILLGSVIGSAITLLFTPKSGEEVRGEVKKNVDKSMRKAKDVSNKLVEETRQFSNNIIAKAENLVKISKDYSSGVYAGSAENFQHEFDRIKKAIRTGIDTYKHYEEEESTQEEQVAAGLVEDYDDDDSPKTEGFGKRRS